MRLFLGCCCAIAIWAQAPSEIDPGQQVALAERPAKELAAQWIKDPRPLYKAWAAEIIRQHEWQPLFGPPLIAALGDINHLDAAGTPETDEDKMRVVILDALIQGQSRIVVVPDNVSLALFRRYPEQALILLYWRRCPLLAVGTQILDGAKSDEAWLVAAQCLAAQRGSLVELVRRLQITLEVKVFDPNRGEPRFNGIPGGTGSAPAGGVTFVPQSLPAWPTPHNYLFSTSQSPGGGVLLRGGRYPVYYARGPTNWSGPSAPIDRNEYTLQILKDKLGTAHEAQPLASHASVELHWTTLEQYRSDLQALVADQQRRYAELVALLVRTGGLTAEESQRCRLNLDIAILDRRANRTQPIPSLGLGDHPK